MGQGRVERGITKTRDETSRPVPPTKMQDGTVGNREFSFPVLREWHPKAMNEMEQIVSRAAAEEI